MQCPSCNHSDAYVGFIKIECHNMSCQHYKPILRENQELTNGKQAPILPPDNPILHVQGHAKVWASPEARQDPVVLQHI